MWKHHTKTQQPSRHRNSCGLVLLFGNNTLSCTYRFHAQLASLTVAWRTCIFCSMQPELHPADCILDSVVHGVNALQGLALPIRVACSKASAWVYKQRFEICHMTDTGPMHHLGAACAGCLRVSCCKHCEGQACCRALSDPSACVLYLPYCWKDDCTVALKVAVVSPQCQYSTCAQQGMHVSNRRVSTPYGA
jgi:hypothetical protein